jgi:hypothetical protein
MPDEPSGGSWWLTANSLIAVIFLFFTRREKIIDFPNPAQEMLTWVMGSFG